jgi:hypothetical protein
MAQNKKKKERKTKKNNIIIRFYNISDIDILYHLSVVVVWTIFCCKYAYKIHIYIYTVLPVKRNIRLCI